MFLTDKALVGLILLTGAAIVLLITREYLSEPPGV